MNPVVCVELFNELNSLKRKIDIEPEPWEYRKRAMNPYECVFSSSNHRGESYINNTRPPEDTTGWRTIQSKKNTRTRQSITPVPIQVSLSAIVPISRAYFKMTELSHTIRKDTCPRSRELFSNPVRVLHLAESPGGFVQSWRWHREQAGLVDDTTCITIEKQPGRDPWERLRSTSRGWKSPPTMLTGDLFDPSIQDGVTRRFVDEGASLVTGDGGFDFSIDYCSQEEQATPLLVAEMVVGLRSLKKDGAFILKVFDVVTLPMLQVLWVFWKCFRSFRLVKPRTSRACNSEKYIVARGFKGLDTNLRQFLRRCDATLFSEVRPIQTLFESGPNASWDTMTPEFRNGIVNVERHMRQQIQTIHRALRINPKENDATRKAREIQSIRISRQWCEEFGIPVSPTHTIFYHPSLDRYISLRE